MLMFLVITTLAAVVAEEPSVGLPLPSSAPSEPDEDAAQKKIDALSEEIEALKKSWAELDENLDKEKPGAAKKPVTKLGGRVHIDNWSFYDSDAGINVIENGDPNVDPQDRWMFRRLRLELEGTVPDNMFWRMQVDFNEPQNPEIKDAYIGWSGLPGNHALVLGNQKRPLGLDHLNSSLFNVFAERPLVVESFNENARGFGLAVYGNAPNKSVGWVTGIFNLQSINDTGRTVGDSLQMGGYGRLFASAWVDETSNGRGYWHMALAGAVAKPDGDGAFDTDSNSNQGRFRTRPLARSDQRWLDTGPIPGADWYEILAVESMFNAGSLQVTGEYMVNFLQRDDFTPPGGFGIPFEPPLDNEIFFHGGYVYVSYFLTGEHNPYDRGSGTLARVVPFENFFLVDRCRGGCGHGWGAFQVALRFDHLDLTDGGVNGGVGNALTGGLNWHWTAYSKLQMNLVHGEISQSGLAGAFDGGHFTIMGARYMIDF